MLVQSWFFHLPLLALLRRLQPLVMQFISFNSIAFRLQSTSPNSRYSQAWKQGGGHKEQDIKWLQSITNLPILVKGILTAEDAELAVQTGAAGIVVSNHGGRQLDFASASITSLEEVVHAVRGRVPVLCDGIRCGTDVFKALALGVQAVLVGRPVIFGLAAKGESGVKKLLEMLHDELELAMSLCGCPSVKDITRSHVRTEHEMMRYML